MQLEHHAGVIVERPAEGGGEADRAHVDAAGGNEAGALLKRVERGGEIELRFGGERAQCGERLVGVAFDREIALEHRRRFRREPARGTQRRLFEKALGDFRDRAPADRRDAGDR